MRPIHRGIVWLALIVATTTTAHSAPYLPDDAEIVLVVEIAPLLDAPVGKQYLPVLVRHTGRLFASPGSKDFDQGVEGVLKLLGTDDAKQRAAFKDAFRRVLVAGPFAGGDTGFLWTIEGKFDPAKFREFAEMVAEKRPLGVTLEPKKPGLRDVCVLKQRNGDVVYFTLADEGRIYLSGVRKRVEDALEQKKGPASPARDQLRARIANVADHPPLWIVAVLDKDDNLESFVGNLTLEDGLRVELRAVAKSPEIARRLKEQLNEKQAEWKKLPATRDWPGGFGLELLKRFTVGASGADIVLKSELSPPQLKDLFPE